MNTLKIIMIASLVLFPTLTYAQTKGKELKYGMTDIEISMLPDYCRARLIGDEETKAKWRKQMGNDIFMHLHHYCSGLNAFKRAKTTVNTRERASRLDLAVKEFNYVISAWPADFTLTKEAQSMKAQVPLMR